MAADKTFEAYEAIAGESLARVTAQPVQHLIGGERRSSLGGSTFENTSPVDRRPLGTIASASAADIDAAARAAADAFEEWSRTPGKERKRILHRVADLIVEHRDEIATVECIDTGQAIRFMSEAALRGAENFRFFADHAPSCLLYTSPSPRDRQKSRMPSSA